MIDGLLEGFSCPYSFKPDLLNILAREHFVAMVELLLARFGKAFSAYGEGVFQAVARLTAQPPANFEVLWSPAIGYARSALQTKDKHHALNAVAHLLLHANVNGCASDWSIRLDAPTDLLCGGVALRHCKAISCLSSATQPTRINVLARDSRYTVQLHSGFAQSDPVDSDVCIRLPAAGTVAEPVFLLCDNTAGDFANSYDTPRCKNITQRNVDSLTDALSLLSSVVPHYHKWVMTITRRLVLVQAAPNQVASGTIEGHCGMYFVSDSDDPGLLSEMLVHESSHQYFNLLALLDNSVVASHVTEYYSPFPRRMRNLDRLLIAYHAFANVAVLYEELRVGGYHSRHALVNRDLLRDVRQIENIIKKDREYLTSVGKGIFDPLLARREALCAVAA